MNKMLGRIKQEAPGFAALIALAVRLILEAVWEKNRRQAENMWENGKPKRWYYVIPVAVIRLLIAGLLIQWVWC